MKRLLSLLLLLYFYHAHAHSSSFLMPRSVTHNATLELALDTYHIYRDETTARSSCQVYVTPFYMQSNNGAALARYFLPNNNVNLNIQENGSGNIGSLWLNLVAPPGLFYSSTMTIAPISKTYGGYLYARIDLEDFFCDECWWMEGAWFSFSFAAMKVSHSLRLTEMLTGAMVYGTIPGITTGIQAFNNPSWFFGKLSPSTLTQAGVDDIQLKLGTNGYYCDNTRRFGFYLVGTIPTGNTAQSDFLFEPLVGTNHAAFGFGIMGDATGSLDDDQQWSIMFDFKYRYLFSGTEMRSFDLLNNKDWSRYLLFVNQAATSVSFPAINFCTLPAKVTPGSQIEYWMAFHYEWCAWNVELGYNLWWRSKDTITILGSLPANTGIYDLAGAVLGHPVSASNANISQSAIGPNQAPSDAVFTPSTMLNPESAAQKNAATNSLYLAFSYNGVVYDDECDDEDDEGWPWLIGLGGGYEWAYHNALAQGSIWAKVGMLF